MNASQDTASLALPNSTATVAATSPPIATTTNVSPLTTTATALGSYKEIFSTNDDTNKSLIDDKTQLLTSKSLNKKLFKHLQLSDNNYVLCMIDVDGLKNINEKLGYDGVNAKISQ